MFSVEVRLVTWGAYSVSVQGTELIHTVLWKYRRFTWCVCADLRPPEMESQMVNKTVRACCEGWGGPRCSEGEDKKPDQFPCTVCTHHPYFTRDASWCRIPQICWLFGNVCKYCATNEILNHYLKIWTNIKIANQSSCIGCDMLDLESKMIWSYDLIRSLMF